jgi:UDP-N-acetylmuramoyl-tripeptide--D-alanyl-D-alanine ligase
MTHAGQLFVPLVAERDGHAYIDAARERGAAAYLTSVGARGGTAVEVPDTLQALMALATAMRSRFAGPMVGITGSVGKTSTKDLARAALSASRRTWANERSFNNEQGLPTTLLNTPEATEVLVVEMGMRGFGEIAALCDIARPSIGVVTRVAEAHSDRVGGIEGVARAKAELVQSLPATGTAILNADDERVRGMAGRTRAAVFTYGLNPEADLRADSIESLGLEGMKFNMIYAGETLHVRLPLLGQHSVHTALRAAAVGLVEKMSWQEILEGLTAPFTQLRLVAATGPDNSLLIDDTYNASPDSMIAALNLIAELDGRKVAVLGDMLELGTWEETGHRMVGARAAEVADVLVTVGERARWIADEAQMQGMPVDRIAVHATTAEALDDLRSRIGAGDVVLVKGSHSLRMDEIVLALEVPEE